jgi:hypothetical protein
MNGNPNIIESGASTGRTYHHFVKIANEMMVKGSTVLKIRLFKRDRNF